MCFDPINDENQAINNNFPHEDFTPKVLNFYQTKLCLIDKIIVSHTISQGILVYINLLVSYKNIGDIFYKFNVYSFWNVVDGIIREKEECDCICTILNSNKYFSLIVDLLQI